MQCRGVHLHTTVCASLYFIKVVVSHLALYIYLLDSRHKLLEFRCVHIHCQGVVHCVRDSLLKLFCQSINLG